MKQDNLNRVRGILSARQGTEIPKFSNSGKLLYKKLNNGKFAYSNDNGATWYDDAQFTQAYSGRMNSKFWGAESTYFTEDELQNTLNSTLPYVAYAIKVQKEIEAQRTKKDAATAIANQATATSTNPNDGVVTESNNETVTVGTKSAGVNTTKEDEEKPIDNSYNSKGMQAGAAIAQGIQMVGDAFGAKQATTDSETTKMGDTLYDGAADIASQFGPVGKAVGAAMKVMGAAGDIVQELGGGTDQMTKTDQWMDSSFFSWNIGALNGAYGKNADSFGADRAAIEAVGSSYGGTVSDITDAEEKGGKKYGLFSEKDRKKANEAIAKAKFDQSRMARIADDATDRRLLTQSMGEQAGLAYSMMTDGGYNQKYTYAAKHGGLLEWNPVTELEWEPQVELNWELPTFKDGGSVEFVEELEWIPEFKDGNKLDFDTWFNSIPEEYRASGYDYKKAYEVFDWDLLSKHAKDPKNNHLGSVSPVADENGNFPFLKLGKLDENKELQGEFDWYNSEEGKEHRNKFDIKFIDGRYHYVPKQLKQGGFVGDSDIPETEETTQKNVIPEGALHKNKHHMEHAEGLTKKGIPVVDGDGEQQAEIEHSEIIFTLEVTKKLEEYYEIFYSEESSNKEKEQAALDAGKLLVYQILENTEDRTGLIESCKKGGTLTFKKDTEELIEEVLEWMPTVVIVETEEIDKKESELDTKKQQSEKDKMKEAIKEVLIELLVK